MIYLDNNATTPLLPEAAQAMQQALGVFGNPSSTHQAGQQARQMQDEARRNIAHMFNVRSEQVVFTSGGTEANVLALRGWCSAYKLTQGQAAKVVSQPTEHSCVTNTLKALAEEGLAEVHWLAVDGNGVIALDALEAALKTGIQLVSLHYANNETGVIYPMADIAALCKRYGTVLHTDAVQVAGKMPLDFAALGADMLTLSFHKLGGPKGVGALLLKNELNMRAVLTGGGHERNRRSGTENTIGIAGAGAVAACYSASTEKFDTMNRLQQVREVVENGLQSISNEVIIVGRDAPRMPNTTAVVVPGMAMDLAVMALDVKGVCVSQGSACSSGRTVPSPVLKALGFTDDTACSGLRISSGWHNTLDDAHAFVAAFKSLYAMQKGR